MLGKEGASYGIYKQDLCKGRRRTPFLPKAYKYLQLEKESIMALVSPGVEVTVIDESQYIPSAVNTVPYFIVASAQNKVSADGLTVAAGTTAANANKTYLITSQRDLAATFGVPFFYNTTTGTPINGYELNEYGLLAAYSALGVTNRAYVQRADIDLTELTASLSRPTGNPNNNTYWVNTAATTWGIFEWNQTTNAFTNKVPLVITDVADVVGGDGTDLVADNTPLETVGSIGDYAITLIGASVFGYYKNTSNTWVQVGSDDWKVSNPTVAGSLAPTALTTGSNLYINGELVAVGDGGTALTVAGFATAIENAAIQGVTAAAVSGRLYIYADSTATNDGSTLTSNGVVSIEAGPTGGTALLAALGITAREYAAPDYFPGYSYQSPRWRTTDVENGRPTGSVWQNLSTANNGLDISVNVYNTSLDVFVEQNCPSYSGDNFANAALDPSGGGRNIPVGSTYAVYNSLGYDTPNVPTMSFDIVQRFALGATEVTGTETLSTSGTPFTVGNQFLIGSTEAGTSTVTTATATIGGTGKVADFINAVSAADIPNVSARVNSAGNIVLVDSTGGSIVVGAVAGQGTPLTTAGFTTSNNKIRPSATAPGLLVLGNWVGTPLFTYDASDVEPDQDPADGRLWYYSSVSDADIMIQDNGIWQGYQNVTNDVRGYDLTLTNASGPIIAASAPTTQNDLAESPLALGDLWIDVSDLENYPKLYRWESVSGVNQWVEVDTTDQVTQNGILFADARWAPNGTTDPVSGEFPTIESLLVSDYLDLDAPNPDLYPQGMLLFNTRRSGYNVKSFQSNYFNAQSFPDDVLPTQKNTWLTASGNRQDGAMWSGRLAQRQLIVQAMKAAIDTSIAAREEQNQFNIIAAPAYPELTSNMIALSNERNNTLFVVADTPMRLANDGNSLVDWATDNNGLGLPTQDGNNATSNYAAAFYPSCLTTDLGGNTVVQPPSHMMVRTILRSDAVSYPWLAPAGTRRGVIDNAAAIGYIDAATGEFQQIGVSQSVRDILYERNINPITFIPGIGIVNFGNKTTTTTTTALDRINVARLVAFLRGRLEEVGKLFLFEPNDEITRNEIASVCNSLMIDLVAKRAIYDYLVVCDTSNNTPARIDRNELWVDIAIEPVKAVEFIYIPLRIKNTGEISGAAA
jgi:Phage tail sheath C-terminal domain